MITVLPRTSTPGIVVPAALGRVDAVADEDDLAVRRARPAAAPDRCRRRSRCGRRRSAAALPPVIVSRGSPCAVISTSGTSWNQLPLLPGCRPGLLEALGDQGDRLLLARRCSARGPHSRRRRGSGSPWSASRARCAGRPGRRGAVARRSRRRRAAGRGGGSGKGSKRHGHSPPAPRPARAMAARLWRAQACAGARGRCHRCRIGLDRGPKRLGVFMFRTF